MSVLQASYFVRTSIAIGLGLKVCRPWSFDERSIISNRATISPTQPYGAAKAAQAAQAVCQDSPLNTKSNFTLSIHSSIHHNNHNNTLAYCHVHATSEILNLHRSIQADCPLPIVRSGVVF
jgi:hypothetical protein